ncbi:class I SAM-dependent methyltransferase [Effusibacillus pohliae]|uniref:class I SAM-dependent methyltransferase n=1 Tax=Effusibacillus pohliae TaxID=232270 RepID=UPI00038263C0|nr:class I SAM-dependent methyltransferase [Effusibacillus pohliae]
MDDSLVVTTVPNPSEAQVRQAMRLAQELHVRYVPRKTTVRKMRRQLRVDQILVAGERLTLFVEDQEVFFHPSMALVRVKRMLAGDTDVLIEKSGLQRGDSVLDCTLGMGADAIVFAHAAGPHGKVVGIERSPVLAVLVREGLCTWKSDVPEFDQAMRRVQVRTGDHLDSMRALPDQSVDVVYFDPMFRVTVADAHSFQPVRLLSVPDPLSPEAVQEAKRIARKSVVLKERPSSGEFERLGFPQPLRRSRSFTYSVIRLREEESQ